MDPEELRYPTLLLTEASQNWGQDTLRYNGRCEGIFNPHGYFGTGIISLQLSNGLFTFYGIRPALQRTKGLRERNKVQKQMKEFMKAFRGNNKHESRWQRKHGSARRHFAE